MGWGGGVGFAQSFSCQTSNYIEVRLSLSWGCDNRQLLIPFGEKMDQLEVYTSLLFDVELFDDWVEEAIEERPAGSDISKNVFTPHPSLKKIMPLPD